ncbi:MAG TPA: hypothetical protein VM487_26030 [Phycisphaerae bacterium]|nr:hypothetical protein [Phycisphaerae bacterium]
MSRSRIIGAGLAAVLAAMLIGCQQQQVDMAEMMKPRPAELDQLEMLVGTWEGTAETKVAGSDEVMTGEGVETYSWDADKWLLVNHFEYKTGDEGEMRGLAIWTWNAKAEKYRIWSFDNGGYCESRSATYDQETKTWHFKGKSRNTVSGEKFVGKGSSQMVDSDTQEWNYTVWDGWKLRKLMEFKGTSHRK